MTFYPSKENFIKKYSKKENLILWMKLADFPETPATAILKLKENEDYCFLFESAEKGKSRSEYSFIVLSPDLIWRCNNGYAEISKEPDLSNFVIDSNDIFSSLNRVYSESKIDIPEELPPMSSGIFGFLGYDMVNYIENLPETDEKEKLEIPESLFIRPQITIIFNSFSSEVILVTNCYYNSDISAEQAYNISTSKIKDILSKLSKENSSYNHTEKSENQLKTENTEISSNIIKEKFINIINKAKEYIYNGDIFQVVLSIRFKRKFLHDHFSLYLSLSKINPSPFMFYLKIKDYSLVGASPEILVGIKGDKVTVRPLAGTRPRGKDEKEDKILADSLLSDKKELAEHLMLLDLGRNDISKISKSGSVAVDQKMLIEKYSHVMHIVSNVIGKIKEGINAIDVIKACFPAGTVSGAPKVRAMEIISELEEEKRSFYAGSVGYISFNGDMDICITLRTALLKDNTLYVQAGAGIVADSIASEEHKEVCNKAASILKAAENLDGDN